MEEQINIQVPGYVENHLNHVDFSGAGRMGEREAAVRERAGLEIKSN